MSAALIGESETFTFQDYNERANRYARWALANGIGKGDVVALFMPNRPDYLAFWLGVARAGGVTALLNTHLRGTGLAHCVNIVRPKHIVVESSLLAAFRTAAGEIDAGPKLWSHGAEAEGWSRLDTALQSYSPARLAPRPR